METILCRKEKFIWYQFKNSIIHTFLTNFSFLYLLKTLESQRSFFMFWGGPGRGYKKEHIPIIGYVSNTPFRKKLFKCKSENISFSKSSFLSNQISGVMDFLNTLVNCTAQNVSLFGVILVCIFPHSDWMWENTDQNNSECRCFSRIVVDHTMQNRDSTWHYLKIRTFMTRLLHFFSPVAWAITNHKHFLNIWIENIWILELKSWNSWRVND